MGDHDALWRHWGYIMILTLTLPSWLTGDYKRSNRRLPCDLAVTRSQLDLFFPPHFWWSGWSGLSGSPAFTHARFTITICICVLSLEWSKSGQRWENHCKYEITICVLVMLLPSRVYYVRAACYHCTCRCSIMVITRASSLAKLVSVGFF